MGHVLRGVPCWHTHRSRKEGGPHSGGWGSARETGRPHHGPPQARQDSSSFAGMSRIKFNGFGGSPSQRLHDCHAAHPGATVSVAPPRRAPGLVRVLSGAMRRGSPHRWPHPSRPGPTSARPGRHGLCRHGRADGLGLTRCEAPAAPQPPCGPARHHPVRTAEGRRGPAAGQGGRWRTGGAWRRQRPRGRIRACPRGVRRRRRVPMRAV